MIDVNKYEVELKDGDEGVEQTIRLMQKYKNKYINHQVIKTIANRLKGYNHQETIKNTFSYVAQNYSYKPDPKGIELVYSPKHTIIGNVKAGDCDDLSVVLSTLLEANGIKTKFRTVAWKKGYEDTFTHVYVIAYDNFNWIALDPSAGIRGYKNEVKYFKKRDW